jgi:hypothetical protein
MSKKFILTLLVAVAASMALLVASTQAAGSKTTAIRTVPIVMRDPGCHWFQVGGKYKVALSVNGATSFRNLDEAALIFKGRGFSKLLPVGKTLTISKPGVYHITMVKQKVDDNHLVLTVR